MAGFTIDEARAGYALAQRDVADARAALDSAQGFRARRAATAKLDEAEGVLAVTETLLQTTAKQLGVSPHAPRGPRVPEPRPPENAAVGARFADRMNKSDVLQSLATFGEARRKQGDEFTGSRFLDGAFLYATGEARTGICVWGEEDEWAISVFSAARVRMEPSLGLYRYVSRWRTTDGTGAPYVVESEPWAAVMCERGFQSSELASDTTAWRLIASTIDLVGDAAQSIARDLAHADGIPFTAEGETGLALLLSWWEVRDERIGSL